MSMLSVPLKTIVPWYADAASGYTPPAGWAVCDGTTYSSANQDVVPGNSWSVPDLRNKFILGATLSKGDGVPGVAYTDGNIDNPTGGPGPKGVGGSNAGVIVLPDNTGVTGSTNGTRAGSVPYDNRPRYYGLVYIMKIKY
jgi:hypothetical protein